MKIPRLSQMTVAAWLTCSGCAAFFSQASYAETTFKLSGYGTVAGNISSDSDRAFRSSMNQSVGADKGFDFFGDSKLGLQGVAKFGDQFSVTGQLLGQRRRTDATANSNEDFNVAFEWLFAQYSPTSNIDLRAGRVVLPSFMISDSRNVGYSQPWLRAPLSVYAGMPLTNLDGGQINFRLPLASAIVTIQPTYGRSSYNLSSGTQAGTLVIKDRTKWAAGLNVSLEKGDWLARVGQVQSRTPDLALDLSGFGLPFNYNMKDIFTSAGIQFDNGSAVVMAEWSKRKMSNLPVTVYAGPLSGQPLAKNDAFYVAGGWRFGSILPMLSYGRTRSIASGQKNHELSASVRWDFMSNVALKAQVSRYNARDAQAFVRPAASGAGGTDADYDKKVNVFSIGLDFVF